MTVVQRDSFGTGRRVPITVRDNPFRDGEPRHAQDGREFVPPHKRPESPLCSFLGRCVNRYVCSLRSSANNRSAANARS